MKKVAVIFMALMLVGCGQYQGGLSPTQCPKENWHEISGYVNDGGNTYNSTDTFICVVKDTKLNDNPYQPSH
jgi:hypothetical protein